MRASALVAIVVSCCLVGVAGAVDTFTVDIEAIVDSVPVLSVDVPVDDPTATLQIVGQLSEAGNNGLAFFAYGLRVTGPRAVTLETAATFDPPLPGVQSGVVRFHQPLGFSMIPGGEDLFNGVPIGDTLEQLGGGQNTINNDPLQAPGVPWPSGPVEEWIGHGDGVVLHEFALTLPPEVQVGEVYTIEIIPDPDGVVANTMKDPTGDNPPKWTVQQADTVIGTSVAITVVTAEIFEVLHTAPTTCTGYLDPRLESDDGVNPNLGIDRVTFVFSGEARAVGGGALAPGSFIVRETGGGLAPGVLDVTGDGITVEVVLSRAITLQEWTTIEANVESARTGTLIQNNGDQGPDIAETDRIDVAALPCDMNQSGGSDLDDLAYLVSYLTGGESEPCGDLMYFDTDRDGVMPEPQDLLRFRQMMAGTSPSTQVWSGATMNSAQP